VLLVAPPVGPGGACRTVREPQPATTDRTMTRTPTVRVRIVGLVAIPDQNPSRLIRDGIGHQGGRWRGS
jgi:hypothetical protein